LANEVAAQWIELPNGKSIKYWHVLFHAGRFSTIDEFAREVSPLLREYSDKTGYEACGVIARNGDNYAIIANTNKSHIACANDDSIIPTGMLSTGTTIHSHGTDKRFMINANDIILLGENAGGGSYGSGTRRNFQRMDGQALDRFSDIDLAGGAGYLATPTGVIYHSGNKKTGR
jgi:hypothetical protein